VCLLVPAFRQYRRPPRSRVHDGSFLIEGKQHNASAPWATPHKSWAVPPRSHPFDLSGRVAERVELEIDSGDPQVAAGPGTAVMFLVVNDMGRRLSLEADALVLGDAARHLFR
jgi:hypothetical protein